MCAQLKQIIISNIRNLGTVDLNFGPQFNVFIGQNGSGKTSFLEAIHFLSVGRSFRARSIRQVISFGADQCLVRAQVLPKDINNEALGANGLWLAVERSMSGEVQYRVGEQAEKSVQQLTRALPVQLIDVNSHLLLEGGPDNRRQFIDWGVFHVEHEFIQNWRLMRRALEQRNVALKSRQMPAEAWNETFIKYSVAIDLARKTYLERFGVIFLALLDEMIGLKGVNLRYNRGWPGEQAGSEDLRAALADTISTDLAYGYTHRGPHRAELEITLNGRLAKDVLSRGQIKIFVCIMLLARAKLLSDVRAGIFLIDDLHAELDQHSCSLFVQALKDMGCQVFITGIEAALLRNRLQDCDLRMFHVEHGRIKEHTT
jgi:DNA replication and repair protein RecF